jgi:hypothetical protein
MHGGSWYRPHGLTKFDMGVACTGHMLQDLHGSRWGTLHVLVEKLMHGGSWYRPHGLQKFYMGVAGTGHMSN